MSMPTQGALSMSITMVRFSDDRGELRWGVVRSDHVHVVLGDFPTTCALLGEGRAEVDRVAKAGSTECHPLQKVVDGGLLRSPITFNQQVICQAVNYRAHAVEAGFGPNGLGANVFFRKASSSL